MMVEKLNLTKLSIIAKDIVDLSSKDLELTDEQIQEANIYLRSEFVKAHMKEILGKDFEYQVRDKTILKSIGKKIENLLP